MKTLLDLLALLIVRVLVGLLRILPRPAARVVARIAVEIILFCMVRSRHVALRNLEIAFPERSLSERKRIYRESRQILADNLVGFAKLPDFSKEEAAARYQMQEQIERAAQFRKKNPGKALILATAHFGGFEELVQALALLMHPVAILVRGFGLERLDRFWNGRRELFGNQVFNRSGAFREIVKRLEQGQDVAMLIDQNVKVNHALFADFFGKKVATTRAVALASIRTGAGIVFAVSMKAGNDRYWVFYREIDNRESESISPDIKVQLITQDLNRAIEDVVREQPECWFWIHRRFKTRPPGETEDLYR